MNENTISYKLDRIKNATDRMRTKTGTIGQPIENVATTVENMDDVNNYFNPTAENTTTMGLYTNIIGGWRNLIKIPVKNKLTSYASYFNNLFCEVDLSELDTSIATNMHYMFRECQLTTLDLSNFNTSNVTNMSDMFYNAKSLSKIDFRNADFSNVSTYESMFYGVPNDCLIIVKDDTQKTWITSKFSNLTNVKTVAEYESNQ